MLQKLAMRSTSCLAPCWLLVVGSGLLGCGSKIITTDAAGAPSGGAGGSAAAAGGAGQGQGGRVSTLDCYSPTQNLMHAYEPNALGCACDPKTDPDVCINGVALVCEAGFWLAVPDGPCAAPVKRFSPSQCQAAGGVAVPAPGGQTAEQACDSGVALGVIDQASSGWDEGGLCCARGQDPSGKACGARAGNTCSSDEFCDYQPGQLCGQADAEALCKPRPTICPSDYAPVCGCAQQTFDNACVANAAGSGVFYSGVCKM
jgi:hypothetical protein